MSGDPREFQKQIGLRVEEFVADITRLAREHAYQSLAAALELAPPPPSSRAKRPAKRESAGRRKRGQAELEEVRSALLASIAEQPGQRIVELAAALGVVPKELALPAKRLIADKLVRTEGQKRSTAYFPTARGKKSTNGA